MTDVAESNVVGFKPGLKELAFGEPNTDIIECLEQLLGEARAGQIQGFAFVSVNNLNSYADNFYGAFRGLQMAGAARLIHKINLELDEE